jgi:hypothetical protein
MPTKDAKKDHKGKTSGKVKSSEQLKSRQGSGRSRAVDPKKLEQRLKDIRDGKEVKDFMSPTNPPNTPAS